MFPAKPRPTLTASVGACCALALAEPMMPCAFACTPSLYFCMSSRRAARCSRRSLVRCLSCSSVSGCGSTSPRALRSSASWRACSAAASRSACLRAARSACSFFSRDAVIALPSRSTPRSKSSPKTADSGANGICALTFLYPMRPVMRITIAKMSATTSAASQGLMISPRPRIIAPTMAIMNRAAKNAAMARNAAPLPTAMPLVLSSCLAIWISSLTWLIPKVEKTLPASMTLMTPFLIPTRPARMPLGLVLVAMPTSQDFDAWSLLHSVKYYSISIIH